MNTFVKKKKKNSWFKPGSLVYYSSNGSPSRIMLTCQPDPAAVDHVSCLDLGNIVQLNQPTTLTRDQMRQQALDRNGSVSQFKLHELCRLVIDTHGIMRTIAGLVNDDTNVFFVSDEAFVELAIQAVCEEEVKKAFPRGPWRSTSGCSGRRKIPLDSRC